MSKPLLVTLSIGLLFALSGCGTPTTRATATPAAAPSPGPTISVWLNACTLLNSRDAASFFATAEVEGPTHQAGAVGHTIFSSEPISATESSCIYYVFEHPGTADMKLLQITYWLDVPNQATMEAWDRVWTDAQAGAAQAISGIGDSAFSRDGRLSFAKDGVYVTIEVVAAGQNFSVPPGSSQQLDLEKQVALFMLPNMD